MKNNHREMNEKELKEINGGVFMVDMPASIQNTVLRKNKMNFKTVPAILKPSTKTDITFTAV